MKIPKKAVLIAILVLSCQIRLGFSGDLPGHYPQAASNPSVTQQPTEIIEMRQMTDGLPHEGSAISVVVPITANSVNSENLDPQTENKNGCCDPAFFASVFNPKEIFCPINVKKVAYWCGYGAIVGGLVALEYYTGALEYVVKANSTIVMTIVYGSEPLVSAINLLIAKYPPAVTPVDEESRIIPTPNAEEVALIIPCHNSEGEIGKTVKAALLHLLPQQIFVIDNGNSELPTDKTKELVAAIDPRINYIWVPIGNKSIAQYAGAMAATDYKYILITDDDVTIPESFDFGTQMINDEVKAVCYPLRGIAPGKKSSLFVEWQDIEYQNADLAKMAESYFGGALYPHGAGSLWDKETLKKALRLHDTVFYADDVKLGLALQKLGKSMKVCASSHLDTLAPTTLFGAPPNYYQQRVRSWEMARHAYFWIFVKSIGMPGPHRSVAGHVYIKASQVMMVVGNVLDYVRLPVFVILAADPYYYELLGLFKAASVVPPLIWNYVKIADRPDLQSSLRAVSTYWVYKSIYNTASIVALLRSLFIYLPNSKPVPTIEQLEEANDPRCVWMQNNPPNEEVPMAPGPVVESNEVPESSLELGNHE